MSAHHVWASGELPSHNSVMGEAKPWGEGSLELTATDALAFLWHHGECESYGLALTSTDLRALAAACAALADEMEA